MENYSLSDIAAANGGGMGGNWILVILFALIFGGGGFGFGNRGCEQYATTSDVQQGFNQQDTASQLRGITYGIADSTYALNNSINGIGNKISDEARALQNGLFEITRNSDANTQKILGAIAEDKMSRMQSEIDALRLQNAMCGVVRYPTATTYATANPYYLNQGCCNNGCGNI